MSLDYNTPFESAAAPGAADAAAAPLNFAEPFPTDLFSSVAPRKISDVVFTASPPARPPGRRAIQAHCKQAQKRQRVDLPVEERLEASLGVCIN